MHSNFVFSFFFQNKVNKILGIHHNYWQYVSFLSLCVCLQVRKVQSKISLKKASRQFPIYSFSIDVVYNDERYTSNTIWIVYICTATAIKSPIGFVRTDERKHYRLHYGVVCYTRKRHSLLVSHVCFNWAKDEPRFPKNEDYFLVCIKQTISIMNLPPSIRLFVFIQLYLKRKTK